MQPSPSICKTCASSTVALYPVTSVIAKVLSCVFVSSFDQGHGYWRGTPPRTILWAWISFPAYISDDSPLRVSFFPMVLHGVGVGDGSTFQVIVLCVYGLRLSGRLVGRFLLLSGQDWKSRVGEDEVDWIMASLLHRRQHLGGLAHMVRRSRYWMCMALAWYTLRRTHVARLCCMADNYCWNVTCFFLFIAVDAHCCFVV